MPRQGTIQRASPSGRAARPRRPLSRVRKEPAFSTRFASSVPRSRFIARNGCPPSLGRVGDHFAEDPRQLQERGAQDHDQQGRRSEEHTSELQSPYDLVCRLLLEKKKTHPSCSSATSSRSSLPRAPRRAV